MARRRTKRKTLAYAGSRLSVKDTIIHAYCDVETNELFLFKKKLTSSATIGGTITSTQVENSFKDHKPLGKLDENDDRVLLWSTRHREALLEKDQIQQHKKTHPLDLENQIALLKFKIDEVTGLNKRSQAKLALYVYNRLVS